MDYSAYLADGMVSGGKLAAYKNHIVKNIEVIGQRKLVVIGGGEECNILTKAIDALRKKNVRVPETAFKVCLRQSEADPDKDIRLSTSLKAREALSTRLS